MTNFPDDKSLMDYLDKLDFADDSGPLMDAVYQHTQLKEISTMKKPMIRLAITVLAAFVLGFVALPTVRGFAQEIFGQVGNVSFTDDDAPSIFVDEDEPSADEEVTYPENEEITNSEDEEIKSTDDEELIYSEAGEMIYPEDGQKSPATELEETPSLPAPNEVRDETFTIGILPDDFELPEGVTVLEDYQTLYPELPDGLMVLEDEMGEIIILSTPNFIYSLAEAETIYGGAIYHPDVAVEGLGQPKYLVSDTTRAITSYDVMGTNKGFITLIQTNMAEADWQMNVPVGDGTVEELSLRGTSALYVDKVNHPYGVSTLAWEEDGYSFTITSNIFSMDQLIVLAESLTD